MGNASLCSRITVPGCRLSPFPPADGHRAPPRDETTVVVIEMETSSEGRSVGFHHGIGRTAAATHPSKTRSALEISFRADLQKP